MRIAIITPTYPPYSSGISRMAVEEIKMLKEAGLEVEVFTPCYSKKCKETRSPRETGSRYKIKYLKPVLKYGNAAFIPQLFFQLRGFDAVHLHYPFLGGAETILLWKKILGRKTPLIITYHMDLKGKGIFKLFFYFYTKIITPIILKSAARIIVTTLDYAQSSTFFQTLFNLNPKSKIQNPKSRLVEIPPSIDINKFKLDRKDKILMDELGIKHDDKIALFVGALDKAHYFKGIPVLLSAFELLYKRYRISNFKLLIVGGGNLKNFYQNLVLKSSVIQDKIIFANKVSEKNLPKYFNLADFLILPSTDSSEAFGIVLLEAYASGKPVLASNLPGVRAVVEIEKTGLLTEPGDVNDLADKLKRMFDGAPLHDWGRNARFLAETKYSKDILGRKLVGIFKDFKF